MISVNHRTLCKLGSLNALLIQQDDPWGMLVEIKTAEVSAVRGSMVYETRVIADDSRNSGTLLLCSMIDGVIRWTVPVSALKGDI